MANAFSISTTQRLSSGRRPRGVVKVNGSPISFLTATVDNKSHFSADTWRVDLEPWNQPEGFGMAYWGDATDVTVEVLVGLQGPTDDIASVPSDLTSLILGQVDDIDIDPLNGNLVISGRDLTAKLIDTKTTNKWPDHVSSWIATKIAQDNGLTPQVTSTSTPVGQFYDKAYVSVSRDIPEWDLLVFLAQQEGFDCYVTGRTLYFGPPQADSDPSPFVVNVQRTQSGSISSNVNRLRLRRSLTLAQDISVIVLSHNVAKGTTVKATAVRAGKKSAGSSSSKAAEKTQNYTIRRPNLSQEQAQVLANQILADLTKFERTIEVDSEGDTTMSVRRMVRVAGTQTSFDQQYYIHNLSKKVGYSGGFTMTFNGKNHSTVSEPAI